MVFYYHVSHTWYVPSPSILLDLITQTMFDGVYRSQPSSFCSLHHSPVRPKYRPRPTFLPQCQTKLRLRNTFTKYVSPPLIPVQGILLDMLFWLLSLLLLPSVLLFLTQLTFVSLLGSYLLQVFRFCRFL